MSYFVALVWDIYIMGFTNQVFLQLIKKQDQRGMGLEAIVGFGRHSSTSPYLWGPLSV